jgi:hypothetical protein
MISGKCFENKWFYMKYIVNQLSAERLLMAECHVQTKWQELKMNMVLWFYMTNIYIYIF